MRHDNLITTSSGSHTHTHTHTHAERERERKLRASVNSCVFLYVRSLHRLLWLYFFITTRCPWQACGLEDADVAWRKRTAVEFTHCQVQGVVRGSIRVYHVLITYQTLTLCQLRLCISRSPNNTLNTQSRADRDWLHVACVLPTFSP